ncbi:MAG: hypothetical protein KBD31_02225 [Proteobacteria bacterium]|nr:hypothetical protein [Pseudomonadota bacterium]
MIDQFFYTIKNKVVLFALFMSMSFVFAASEDDLRVVFFSPKSMRVCDLQQELSHTYSFWGMSDHTEKRFMQIFEEKYKDPDFLKPCFDIVNRFLTQSNYLKMTYILALKKLITHHPVTIFKEKNKNPDVLIDHLRGLIYIYNHCTDYQYESIEKIISDALVCEDDWVAQLGVHLLNILTNKNIIEPSPYFLRIQEICQTIEIRNNFLLIAMCQFLTSLLQSEQYDSFISQLKNDPLLFKKIRRQLDGKMVKPFLVGS